MGKRYVVISLGRTGAKYDNGKNSGATSSIYPDDKYPEGYLPLKEGWQPPGLWVEIFESQDELNKWRESADFTLFEAAVEKAIVVQVDSRSA